MSSTIVDDAFERLYRLHVRDVYRFALALLRNPAEAEDVTQTTFLNAYRAIQAGEEPRRPQNWLLTIAHNTARSRVRRAMRRPREVPLDDVVNQLAVPEHERTNVRELLRALGRLPFNQRAAITMRELEGRSYPEIAETLGVTVPAVEALLTRARKSLRLQAAAIRGLTVIGLPRSLRRLLENGETLTGGALGAGVVAKVAAVVMAGVVAGGIGFGASDAGTPKAQAPSRPTLVRHFELVEAPVAPRRTVAPAAASTSAPVTARLARPQHAGTTPASKAEHPGGTTATPGHGRTATSTPAAPAATTAPAKPRRVRKVVATGAAGVTAKVIDKVSAIAGSAAAAVPPLPAVPPVQLPEPPPVPAVPDPPPLPSPPDLPKIP